MCPRFTISFDLYVNSYEAFDADFLHLTDTGDECCDIGDRVPVFRTTKDGRLQFGTAIDDNGNFLETSPKLPPKTWFNIRLEQSFSDDKVFLAEFIFTSVLVTCLTQICNIFSSGFFNWQFVEM